MKNILSPAGTERIKSEVSCKDIKNVIVKLFFLDNAKKELIISAIKDEIKRWNKTESRFSVVIVYCWKSFLSQPKHEVKLSKEIISLQRRIFSKKRE